MSFLRHQALPQRSILFKQSLSSVCSLFPLQLGLTLTPTEGLWNNSTQGMIWQGGCWQGIISSSPLTWINFPLSMRKLVLLPQRGMLHSPFIYSGISWVSDLYRGMAFCFPFFFSGQGYLKVVFSPTPKDVSWPAPASVLHRERGLVLQWGKRGSWQLREISALQRSQLLEEYLLVFKVEQDISN